MNLLNNSSQRGYNKSFFKRLTDSSRMSAENIVPIVIDIFKPTSVVDIGCGTGPWLSVFEKHGCKIFGIDGDYVKKDMLCISPDCFISGDLLKKIPIQEKFDLLISFEVAEHLLESRADSFVKELTELAPVVLFSAAIPFQGGKSHVNEQWQDYWAKLFKVHGYSAFDVMRPKIWSNENVASYYRSNMLVYCSESFVEHHPELLQYQNNVKKEVSFNIVHPELYLKKIRRRENNKKWMIGLAVLSAVLLMTLACLL